MTPESRARIMAASVSLRVLNPCKDINAGGKQTQSSDGECDAPAMIAAETWLVNDLGDTSQINNTMAHENRAYTTNARFMVIRWRVENNPTV